MASKYSMNDRPSWPRRAIVTAGEPYGNKGLHFGHVGGVFVPADFFARFLRDRLGRENVIFTSGTDCYGSPIMESYRKLKENEGYDKSIGEYVESNHSRQAATLNNYNISCDIYGGSGLEPAAQIHNEVTAEIIKRLHEQGKLTKMSTKQFFDAKAGTFLNGRQVIGRCPIQGCKSEKAYADECDLGHQFEPEELIAPKSQLTGEVPELRPVDNLYFDLPAYLDFMKTYTAKLAQNPQVRSVVSNGGVAAAGSALYPEQVPRGLRCRRGSASRAHRAGARGQQEQLYRHLPQLEGARRRPRGARQRRRALPQRQGARALPHHR